MLVINIMKTPQLTDKEKQSIKLLNWFAEHDGIMEEHEIICMLKHGINKFISKKHKNLLEICQKNPYIRIKISKQKNEKIS